MRHLFLILIGLFSLQSCYYDNRQELYQHYDSNCDTIHVSFANDIIPLMQQKCVSCHTAADPNGNVNLETYTDIKTSADNGGLYGSMAALQGYSRMPPTGNLPQCDVNLVEAWIRNGSPNN